MYPVFRARAALTACLVAAFASSAMPGRAGATSLVAADVLVRHDVAAATRAEIAGQRVDQATRTLGPVGGTAFNQVSSSALRGYAGGRSHGPAAARAPLLDSRIGGSLLGDGPERGESAGERHWWNRDHDRLEFHFGGEKF